MKILAAWVAASLVLGGAAGGALRRADRAEVPDSSWPADAGVALAQARPTLVIFLRPGGAQTSADLDRLARLERESGGVLAVRIRIERPEGLAPGWDRLPIWRRAIALSPEVGPDIAERAARRFALRPGEAAVFAPSGRRLYSGALTGPRARAALARVVAEWRTFGGFVIGRPLPRSA